MAGPYNPPIKNQDFLCRISLADLNTAGAVKAAPTLAVGDFLVVTDGATAQTLLSGSTSVSYFEADAVNTKLVKVYIDATAMNGDNVTLLVCDQTSPKEWADLVICIPTTSS